MPGVTSHPDFSALLKFSLRCQRKFSGVMQVDGVGFTLQGPTQGGDRLGHLIHASRRHDLVRGSVGHRSRANAAARGDALVSFIPRCCPAGGCVGDLACRSATEEIGPIFMRDAPKPMHASMLRIYLGTLVGRMRVVLQRTAYLAV